MSLTIHPRVGEALATGRPVVALESTVLAHGLPWPENLALGRELERIVREAGAEPATIAVVQGALRVGLEPSEIERIAQQGRDIPKVSRRDLPVVVARALDGATTVAATMCLAHRAGIRVMATGGIGGVHRGRATDISADLPELAQTPMLVVCSGAKVILDLTATLEWLETHGVPVVGFGTDRFPAFWCADSGLSLRVRVETPGDAVAIARAGWTLGLPGATIVAVPCPAADAVPRPQVEEAVSRAIRRAEEQGITGSAVTPFLLRHIAELTEGATVRANLALLKRNTAVAAALAGALP